MSMQFQVQFSPVQSSPVQFSPAQFIIQHLFTTRRECLGVDIGGSCGSIGGGCGLHGMCAYIHWLDRRFCMHEVSACMGKRRGTVAYEHACMHAYT